MSESRGYETYGIQRNRIEAMELIHYELQRGVEGTDHVPFEYYAHTNTRGLLREIVPEMANDIDSMSHGQAMQATCAVAAFGVSERFVMRDGFVSTPSLKSAISTALVTTLHANGLKVFEIKDYMNTHNMTMGSQNVLTSRKNFLTKLRPGPYADLLRSCMSLEVEPQLAAYQAIATVAEKIEPEVGAFIGERLADHETDSVINADQIRKLSGLFPMHAADIQKLTYGQLTPLLLHMAAAFMTARYAYRTHKSRGDNTHAATIFIDCLLGVSGADSAAQHQLSGLTVSRVPSHVASQLAAFDSRDRDDIFRSALGMEVIDRQGQRKRKLPADISLGDGHFSHVMTFPDLERNKESEPTRSEPVTAHAPITKPPVATTQLSAQKPPAAAAGTTPDKKPPAAVARASVSKSQVTAIDNPESLLAGIETWEESEPVSDDIARVLGALSVGRWGLTMDERRLIEMVAPLLPSEAGQKRPPRQTLEQITMKFRSQDLTPEQVKANVAEVIKTLITKTGWRGNTEQ